MINKYKKIKKKSSSCNKKNTTSIKIKPFTKPPSLPTNFYQSSTNILYNSLKDILHHQTTTKENNNTASASASSTSHESLYKIVTDLCHHGFGPRLYHELVTVLDDAAKTCALRLVENSNSRGDEGTDTISYPTHHCVYDETNTNANPMMPMVSFTHVDQVNVELDNQNDNEEEKVGSTSSFMSDSDNMLLNNIWKMFSDYIQYLNHVRLIFQPLDGMFIYFPKSGGSGSCGEGQCNSMEARVIQRNDSGIVIGSGVSGTAAASSSTAKTTNIADNSTANNNTTIAANPWDMWDVGINCIFGHMGNYYNNDTSSSNIHKNDGEGDSVMEDISSTNAVANIGGATTMFSILDTMKQRIIACVIKEMKAASSPLSKSKSSYMSGSFTTQPRSNEILHQPIIRDCISIFRSFSKVAVNSTSVRGNSSAHSGATSIDQKMDVMDDFLHGLVNAMKLYLTKESQSFMSMDDSTPTMSLLPMDSSYDTRSILRHIDSRLKQVNGITTYYKLSALSSSSSTSPNESMIKVSSGVMTQSSKVLSHLVETYLLTPHFSIKYILHPMNLYPILNDDSNGPPDDVKLLFQLSKRVHSYGDTCNSVQDKNMNSLPYSPGMELLRIAFEAFGKDRGLSIIRPNLAPPAVPVTIGKAVKPPPPMTTRDIQNQIVINLLKFKSHLEYLLKEAFSSDQYFLKTLRKVLEDVLNQGDSDSSQEHNVMSTTNRRKKNSFRHSGDDYDGGKRIAELLAKYIDLRFKNSKVSLSTSPVKGNVYDGDMEIFQVSVIALFRHIQSKDVFEAFYRRDLSKRLLLNKSASIDVERSFVSKLKAECGTGYVTKMEGMFKDMELSKDVMNHYSAYRGSLEDVSSRSYSSISKTGVDMDVQVLTTGYWPVQTNHPNLNLPDSLKARKDHFESYYLSKYQGRRIAWQNTLGNCIVKAYFPKVNGPKELNVSLHQALVLQCFNVEEDSEDDPQFTIFDIMEKTGIEDRSEVERLLQSLSMGRDGTQVLRRVEEKVMVKDSDGTSTTPKKKHKSMRKSVSDSDIFMFNSNFFSNQRRIRITNIQMREIAEERTKTQEGVTVDRLYLIDAAIVRIMKARKTLEHRILVGEVMKQIKFPASGTDIKKQIEKLIDREYLERADSSTYNYLA